MAIGQETVLDDYAFLVSETDAKGTILFANTILFYLLFNNL